MTSPSLVTPEAPSGEHPCGEPQARGGMRSLDPALLLQTANGNVEAKVVCFYRRRDISSTLIALADKHASESPSPALQPACSCHLSLRAGVD